MRPLPKWGLDQELGIMTSDLQSKGEEEAEASLHGQTQEHLYTEVWDHFQDQPWNAEFTQQ